MHYSTRLALALSTLTEVAAALREIEGLLAENRSPLEALVAEFFAAGPSPASAFDFETRIAQAFRELARRVVEHVYNRLEGGAATLPQQIRVEGEDYRRLNEKTPQRHVATLLGTITLWRHGYRPSHRGSAEATVFPLEEALGLVGGATPALAEAAGRYLAEGGATQRTTLDRLKSHHGVCWGAERLRRVTAEVARSMASVRHELQVERLVELLRQADVSRGTTKPVLSVGRDGITLRESLHSFCEVSSVGTAAVYDRAGKRLGTVYLAAVPESCQPTMGRHLTELIEGVLKAWDGTLPRLAYVTDAGDNETAYYRRVLRPMRHPRTGAKLAWVRVVDYYHASQRLWTMASALFGADKRAAAAWAKRMAKLLKKPNGPFRVLHSAGQLRARRTMPKWRENEFRTAYNYIRERTQYMQYAEYARVKIPLGSGVTEAACKTVVAQRLKLSGMRWTKEGAQAILDLRVMLLSGLWAKAYRRILNDRPDRKRLTPVRSEQESMGIAA
jgi:hypothetical protein